ncbi:ABC transporter ATP-binding protein [Thermoanaerobacter sp. CM-CNRG TB177]|jgi:putative ABC transport system ATP-binding protein|uniref:ABC transporter related n=2 Tax=Thermoanaerobacter TaxID=1754 RepID=B0K8Y3_THEP3|nr:MULTISPECIES: ABC transporter ATP-binding protein [Thermoanaerobacter]KUJ89921.1 MAG: ABC transporter-like protein [Thermoanaerobacter thermocopriae]ABY94596.1 ABC transporter related [Thermoanaerobacter pseudethanolicus ATCC 33223]ADV79545.1 ABC transporter related protein [Thermoanaerobacter brockii subsp. finnii Ako-1]HBW59981.1 ABC transporter ATP-binding protein [Thermoanaerobacter sp.]HCD10368.1 ABC transporter ATP-binding protein [Thermoanaerobacter sp.]
MLIKTENVKKEYMSGKKKNLVLKGVNLEINAGEKIAIVGPSGSGKTTLLNIIGLLLPATEGEVYLAGKRASTLKEKERAKLRNKFFGYVFQEFLLVEEDTVFQNIEIPLLYSLTKKTKSEKRKMVEEVLEKVGLEVKINEKVRNLSGGERQRVAIARAIINDPEVILADEPTGSLDAENGEKIMDILESLVDKGKTLLIVTHNEAIAKRCDRIFRIKDGYVEIEE